MRQRNAQNAVVSADEASIACSTLSVPLSPMSFEPVNRARLARYLELPSVAQIDPITDAEIRRLDEQRHELLSFWACARLAPIARIDGARIVLPTDAPAIEATDRFGRQLLDRSADSLIIAAFSVGERVDQIIRAHLQREEIFEAFILKQWSATIAEQARAELTRRLRGWAGLRARSLMPYDGPGYNGWPLASLGPLLELLYNGFDFDDTDHTDDAIRPLRVTESGVLLPTNSMLIVYGLTPMLDDPSNDIRNRIVQDDSLAQCHRCAMKNCNYRTAAATSAACVE